MELQSKITLCEQLLLLTISESGSCQRKSHEITMRTAVTGACLMDLAFLNRIDNDLDFYFVVSDEATDEPHLDFVLELIKRSGQKVSLGKAVGEIYQKSEEIYQLIMARLLSRGILAVRDQTYLWVFNTRRYPVLQPAYQSVAKQKIFTILTGDEIPDPRDVALVSLAYETDILRLFLSDREVLRISERVHHISQLDLTAQAIRRLSDTIKAQMAALSAALPH